MSKNITPYRPIMLIPRTDIDGIPPLKYVVMWEKGHEGNDFIDTPFIGYVDNDGDIYMYPEAFVDRDDKGDRLPIVAWSPIAELEKF